MPIHPSATIEDGAVVHPDASVWHHAQVRTGAVVGAGTNLGKNVFVDVDAVIGERCKIANNVNVYRGVIIEDEVFVGPSATFTNDMFPRAVSPDWELVPTLVKRGASIGANATIRCGVTIGEYAMIGAGSVVTRDVEPYELVYGNPARHRGWVDESGRLVSDADERPQD